MILTKNNIKAVDLDFLTVEKIKAGMLNELLLIVPTNRKIRYLKREIISQTASHASGRINLETIGTFASKLLFVDGNSSARSLSEAASAVVLMQCFLECELKYFSIYKNKIPHGTLTRIGSVISEYKRHGITPDNLRKESQELEGSEKNKAVDISNLYEAYQHKCKQLNVKDTGDIYNELNKIAADNYENNFRKLFPAVKLVVINGFDEFTTPEIEIINLTSDIKNLEQFISFDYYAFNPSIFSHLDKCYDKLSKKGFSLITDLSAAVHNKFRTEIRENLFKYNIKGIPDRFSDSITKIIAGTREEEIKLIAKEIKELIFNKQTEPGRICVAFNLIQKYSPVVRDIFYNFGIPFNLTDRIQLNTASPVISIINFLEILENDFYYKNIFRALSGGYLVFKDIDTSNLLKASVNLKIISGYDNWVNMLQDAVLRLQDIEDGDNPELGDKENCLPDRQVYTRALSDLKRLNSYLLPFEKAMTIKEFYNNLNNLIFSLNLPSNLINDRSDSIEENLKGLTVFLELMKEIFELFEIEFGKTKKFPLGFFLTNLKTAVSTSRFNIKEKPGYGVQITTLEEIRGLKFDYLFISGLCDGDLPTRYSPEIFFSGSYRKNENNHQTEERYRFYQSLCTWDRHLYLTYPLREEKKELVESNFLTEFSNLINSKIKYEKNYSDAVYSKDELMIYLGQTKCKNLPEELERDLEIDLEHIKKSISINEQRIMLPFGESEYTGYIKNELSESIKNELSDFKFKEYSISQLETYAKCPYKYMAERILKLEPVKEPTEEIEALEMGSILHKILFKFYETIKSKEIILAQASEKQIDYAENLIFEIGEKMLEEANFKSPSTFYEKEKILGINGNRQNSVLYMFLDAEIKNKDGYIPQFFEINFGRAGGDRKVTEEAGESTAPTQIMIDTISVVGKIDRIDIDKEGQKYKVVDYKLSGNKPTASDIRGGISLQLPLYLFAAKELIKAQYAYSQRDKRTGRLATEPVPTGAEIYSLKFNDAEFGKQLVKLLRSSSKTTRVSVPMGEEQLIASYEEMIKICLDAVKKYVNAIIEGKFNLSMLQDRENKICGYCGFRSICRIQEVS